MTLSRWSLLALAAAAVSPATAPASGPPDPTAGAAATRGCGYVDVPGGRAWKIYATRITCTPARKVARRCLRGTVPYGWRVAYNANNDRTTLRSRRNQVVSFQLVGGGGCIPVRR